MAVVILAVLAFTLFSNDAYKNVEEDYIKMPNADESVRFSGTYFGKTASDSQNDLGADVDVVRVGMGNTFVFIKGNHSVKLEGKFVSQNRHNAVVNGLSVSGYEFAPDHISAA